MDRIQMRVRCPRCSGEHFTDVKSLSVSNLPPEGVEVENVSKCYISIHTANVFKCSCCNLEITYSDIEKSFIGQTSSESVQSE